MLLEAYLAAAVDHLDGRAGILGRCLLEQEWQAYADRPTYHGDRGPCGAVGFRIDLGPVQTDAAIAIEYRQAGAWHVVDPAAILVAELPAGEAFLTPALGQSWPAADAVPNAWRITFMAGHDDVADVPAALRAAILLIASDLYGDRGGKSVASMVENPTVGRLLGPYRKVTA